MRVYSSRSCCWRHHKNWRILGSVTFDLTHHALRIAKCAIRLYDSELSTELMRGRHSRGWHLNCASPDLDDRLQYLQVVTQHLSVVMVTVTQNKLQHAAH